MARAHQRQYAPLIEHTLDQQLDPAAAALVPEQARLEYTGVVEHENVIGLEQLRQIGEAAIGQCAVGRIQGQQPAFAPLSRRMLRNQLARQVEVERIELHGRAL